jgi:hypothetical protein
MPLKTSVHASWRELAATVDLEGAALTDRFNAMEVDGWLGVTGRWLSAFLRYPRVSQTQGASS